MRCVANKEAVLKTWIPIGAALILSCACAEPLEEVVRPVVTVERGDLIYSGSFYGELEAKESQAIHVPQLNGVDYLTVDTVLADGTMVKKDEVVLKFLTGPLEDDLRASKTDLDVVQAEYQRTVHDLDQERVRLELDVKRKLMAVERAELFVVSVPVRLVALRRASLPARAVSWSAGAGSRSWSAAR